MPVEVEFYTRDHILQGLLETGGDRVTDILNGKTESAVYLRRTRVTRLLQVGKVTPLEIPVLRVEKRDLLFAVPVAERDLTHKSLYKRASRQSYEIFIGLPNFELTGSIHLTERLDVRRVFVTRADDYIPLTNATAIYVLHPRVKIQTGTIIFNKAQVILVGEPESLT